MPVNDTDVEYPFYQESNFYYLFGVDQPDCYAIIDIEKSKSYLFIPKLDNQYKIWMTVMDQDDYRKRFFEGISDVEVIYSEEIDSFLRSA